MSIAEFIESNRQMGSTAALVEACLKTDGYLVVHNLEMGCRILKRFPELKPERVLTIGQISSGRASGLDKRPLFIDVPVLSRMES